MLLIDQIAQTQISDHPAAMDRGSLSVEQSSEGVKGPDRNPL